MIGDLIINQTPESFRVIGEQLDTPLFQEQDVAAVIDSISALSQETFPIVLAHHNILPQSQSRIDIYTETINSGLVRSRLTNCGRTVIYCHGHIHTEPIEILQVPDSETRIIAWSVPPLVDGFDKIEIHYGSDGIPIGCTAHRYRVQDDGGVTCSPKRNERIAFFSHAARRQVDNKIITVLSQLEYAKYIRGPEIERRLKANGLLYKRATIKDLLLEAEWLGFVRIENREDDLPDWQVEKLQP